MIGDAFGMALLALVMTFPAYILLVILGPIILIKYRLDPLSRPAGLFTLKPLIATPILAILITLFEFVVVSEGVAWSLSMIPAVLLTLLILLVGRRGIREDPLFVLLLLVGDAVRWLNTLAYGLLGIVGGWNGQDALYFTGLLLPNLYAIMAFIMLWWRLRQRSRRDLRADDASNLPVQP